MENTTVKFFICEYIQGGKQLVSEVSEQEFVKTEGEITYERGFFEDYDCSSVCLMRNVKGN